VQRIIWQYNLKNEYFTLNKLLADVRESLEYTGSRSSVLYKTIKNMGYKFNYVNGRKILCEQNHVARKIKFLRDFLNIKQNSNERTFVYLDETWIFQNGSAVRRWIHEKDIKSNPSKIHSEGKRFIVLHAGSRFGFLDGCSLLLDSNNDKDYHRTMNGEIFKNWVILQLITALSQLQDKCVVVMDNAPYHSVQLDKPPTFSSKKAEMQEWLEKRGTKIQGKITKKILWEHIKLKISANQKRYEIDTLLQEHGHEVLRLPPYHCQYNPIEMAWGFCKTYYNKHINSRPSSKDKVKNLWVEALAKCTSGMWQNFCDHCTTLIEQD
jgi:hypothetical protein